MMLPKEVLQYLSELGIKGGNTVYKKYGAKFYSRIGKVGGKKARTNDKKLNRYKGKIRGVHNSPL